MIISEENIQYIETNLKFYGIIEANLRDDIFDHICTHIENHNGTDFEEAYQESIHNLGGYATIQFLQKQINEKAIIKSFLMRKKVFFLISTFNLMILSAGLLFKLNQWPYSSILLAVALGLLVFATLPLFCYNRYRLHTQKIILFNK